MAEQLPFSFPARVAFGQDDFFTSAANQAAVDGIETWQNWPDKRLYLSGPAGAGKTHLARIWCALAGACVWCVGDSLPDGAFCVEDVQNVAGNQAAEEALFHVFNHANHNALPFLVTGRQGPSALDLNLADLQSRLQSMLRIELAAPDDTLLAAVLLKNLNDRQLSLDPKLLAYLTPRIERSFEFVTRLAAELDQVSLAAKKPLNRKIVAQALDSLRG